MMRPGLLIGERHVVRYTVPVNQMVPDLLPELAEFRRGQPVFATGFMVGLMEAPCMAAVHPHLEPGEATVGTVIDMSHLRASPPGTELVAEARAIEIEGRSVRFAVVVEGAAGELVAAGVHALRVIDVARFRDRLAAKRAEHLRPSSVPHAHEAKPLANQPPPSVVHGGGTTVARAAEGSPGSRRRSSQLALKRATVTAHRRRCTTRADRAVGGAASCSPTAAQGWSAPCDRATPMASCVSWRGFPRSLCISASAPAARTSGRRLAGSSRSPTTASV